MGAEQNKRVYFFDIRPFILPLFFSYVKSAGGAMAETFFFFIKYECFSPKSCTFASELDYIYGCTDSLVHDGIYELKTRYGVNIFRVFFILDEGEIVILSTDSKRRLKRHRQTK